MRKRIAIPRVSETGISFGRIFLDRPNAGHRSYMTEIAIDIVNVTKRYAEHVAVRDLTLRVPTGSVYGLLGPNGAGKTTTIRMILNIIAPDSGAIHIFGRPSNDRKITERLGYLPEERGLYRKMQVRRVLKFLAELKGVRGKEAEKRIDEWLVRLSLKTPEKDWGLAKIDELSRGMQQKVQFIGTLLHDPDLVILDEPFSGLDPINAQALKDTVVDLKKRGKTVILSVAGESRNAIAHILADRTLVARFDDQNRFYEINLAPGADPQQLLRRVMETGAPIQRFELVQPSLHQIFLEKVGASGVEEGMSG